MIEDDGGSEESREHECCSKHSVDEELESRQSNLDQFLPEDPGLWPDKLTNDQRDTIVRRLASKGTEKTNKMPPKDMEGKPFPIYLEFVKSANGREKNQKRLAYS